MSDTTRKATYQDVLDAPEHLIAEIIRGELVINRHLPPLHAYAATCLGTLIGAPFHRGRDGPGGWWILRGPELHFEDDVVVPNIAGWRRERMPAIPAVDYLELAPDWVCEVLSPATEAVDRTDKLEIYGAAQVEWVWLLNPILRTLEVFENSGGKWVRERSFRGEITVRAQPFDAVELALADLWLPTPT